MNALLAAMVFREELLTRLGGFLVVRDAPLKADLILVLSGAPVERMREAADLYREQWAPTVVLTNPAPPAGHAELAAAGVRIPLEPEISRSIAIGLGVAPGDVVRIPEPVDSTAAEARVFRDWLETRAGRRVIIVTSPFHTRRVRRLFREVLAGSGATVAVLPSRYGTFRPESWWKERSGVRAALIEYQKLLFYALPGHGW